MVDRGPDYYRARLKQVDRSDGVSKEEAIVIAQNYLIDQGAFKDFMVSRPKVRDSKVIDGCWAVSFPRTLREMLKHGPLWSVVEIEKRTGQIKASGGWPDF